MYISLIQFLYLFYYKNKNASEKIIQPFTKSKYKTCIDFLFIYRVTVTGYRHVLKSDACNTFS
jgi:hypothetical protein